MIGLLRISPRTVLAIPKSRSSPLESSRKRASRPRNVEAWDAQTGKPLWYSQIRPLQNPPETFMLDGKQHVLFTGSGSLHMFVLT